MKKLFIITSALLFSAAAGRAQRFFGVASSNWSGTSALYLNPALLADNREEFSIDLFSLNVGADNNLGTFSSVKNLVNRAFSGNSNDVSSLLKYTTNGNFNMMAPYVEVRGPGFLVNIKQKHTIAVSTRIRAMNQFNNFGKTLYQIIADPQQVPVSNDYPVYNKNFNWTAQLWSEVGVTYATTLFTSGRSRLNLGVTGRYLGGIGYLAFKGNNLDVYYRVSNDSLHASNSDFQYASNLLSTNNAYNNGLTNQTLLNTLFGPKNASGIGGDIGLVYEYRTNYEEKTYEMDGRTDIVDHSKNHYKFRISAAVTDLGSINYKSGSYQANVTGNGAVTGQEIAANSNNFGSFMTYVAQKGFHADTSLSPVRLYMPASLLLSFDYHAARHVYVNATYVSNIGNRQNFGNTWYNQLTVTPRYDSRRFSFGLPLTYSALNKDFKMGFGARFYGFFVGSDDMLAYFSNNHFGFNFYMGAHVPLNHKIPKDRDGDGVSDRKDRCPNDPGPWENHGCPEEDSEHGGSPDDNVN